MNYAISDLHGCLEKYEAMLNRLDLRDGDLLYVLGDVVDRGEGGIKIILDLLSRKNAVCLRGNHDHTALLCLSRLTSEKDALKDENFAEAFRLWLSDGGAPTAKAFLSLPEGDRSRVLGFLNSLPFRKELEIGGKKFFLAHTVPEKEKMTNPKKRRLYDFILGEPEYEKRYFDDVTVVTGHTPTGLIDPAFRGRIWRGNGHAAIDCGAVFGGPLGCLCLDTLEEVYADVMSDG